MLKSQDEEERTDVAELPGTQLDLVALWELCSVVYAYRLMYKDMSLL